MSIWLPIQFVLWPKVLLPPFSKWLHDLSKIDIPPGKQANWWKLKKTLRLSLVAYLPYNLLPCMRTIQYYLKEKRNNITKVMKTKSRTLRGHNWSVPIYIHACTVSILRLFRLVRHNIYKHSYSLLFRLI